MGNHGAALRGGRVQSRSVTQSSRQVVAHELADACRQWCELPLKWHAVIVAALVLLVVVSSWDDLTYAEPLRDERAYAAAFEAARDGRDPYQGTNFLYPPIFAQFGGWVTSRFDVMTAMALIRITNVLGVVTCSWLAVIWLPLALRWRVLASAGMLVGSPSVLLGLECSYLSLAISGLMAVALIASLPLQATALAVWWLRRGWKVRFEGVGVALAILASQTAQGVTGVYTESPWLQAAGVLVPSCAPILLAAYLVWAADSV